MTDSASSFLVWQAVPRMSQD